MNQRTHKRGVILLAVGTLVGLFVAFGLRTNWQFTGAGSSGAAIAVPADSIDAGNEGRLVSVSGRLTVEQPPEDPELGLQVPDAIVLVREVEMFQWRQACSAGSCVLKTMWSPELIDSTQFGETANPQNPQRFPIASDRFVGKGLRLGAFVPDADLLVSGAGLAPRPVSLSELSNNLAASFSVADGVLVSSNDPEHPLVGDLRVRYRIVAAAEVNLIGIQQSPRLVDPALTRKP
ncbi:MAG: hypothetical protein IPP82_17115 [Xanthomonadales bacterium]|nr:hypothetical protein [Xanthomonadales bacterium]